MAISTQTQNLNLIPGKSAPVVVHLSQGNVGDTVQFYLYNGNSPYIPTNVNIVVHGLRGDGTAFGPYKVNTTSGSNLVSFAVNSSMTYANGTAFGELAITDVANHQIGTANFGMVIEEAPYKNITYSSDLSMYQRLLSYVQSSSSRMNSQIDALNTRIDEIIVPSGGAPSAAEVTDARIGADGVVYNTLGTAIRTQVGKINEIVGNRQYAIKGAPVITPVTVHSDGIIVSTPVGETLTFNTQATYQHCYISVKAGDSYIVTVRDAKNYAHYFVYFTNSSNVVIDRALPSTGVSNVFITGTVTVPANATRMHICSFTNATNWLNHTFCNEATIVYAADGLYELNDIVGGKKFCKKGKYINISSLNTDGYIVKTPVGEVLTFGENINYQHCQITVVAGDSYIVTVLDGENHQNYFVYFTDNNDVVIDRAIPSKASYDLLTDVVTVPANATRMHICSHTNATTWTNYTSCNEAIIVSVVDGLYELTDIVGNNKFGKKGEQVDISSINSDGAPASSNLRVGDTLTFNTQAIYQHCYISVKAGDSFIVTVNDAKNFLNYFVFFTNNNDVIIKRDLPAMGVTNVHITGVVTAPFGATRMHIFSFTNSAQWTSHASCYRATLVSVVDELLDLNERLDSSITPLPSWYTDNWLNERIESVKENTNVFHGVSFGFITDVHMQANQGNSATLMRKVLDETTVPFCVFGGDVPRAYGSQEDLHSDADKWFEWVKKVRDVFQIRGNHDYTIRTAAGEETGYTEDDKYTYNRIMRMQEWEVEGVPSKYYYMLDNRTQKIRMLFLDGFEGTESGEIPWAVKGPVSQEQYDWIIEKLSEVDNYDYIIFTHMSPDTSGNIPYSGGWAGLSVIGKAVNNKRVAVYDSDTTNVHINHDFSNTTNRIVCYISGHNHMDRSNVDDGVLSITTTSDATYNDDSETTRTSRTTTEQAFDVFSIDLDARTIKTVRFGGGTNRSWTF